MKHYILITILVYSILGLCTSCTLRFEAEKLKLDADPIEHRIGSIEKTNTSYKLVALDVFKNARLENTTTP